MKRSRVVATITSVIVAVTLAGGGAAQAAPTSPVDAPDDGLTKSELTDRGVRLDEPGVAAEVDRILAAGGVLLDAQRVDYVETKPGTVPTSAPVAAAKDTLIVPAAFPSGCGLTVLLYRQVSSVHSSSVTSCSTAYTAAQMENFILFWAWLQWNDLEVASAGSSGTTSYTVNNVYFCANSNSTEYRTETYGELWKGGSYYMASAYDIFDAGAQACGT